MRYAVSLLTVLFLAFGPENLQAQTKAVKATINGGANYYENLEIPFSPFSWAPGSYAHLTMDHFDDGKKYKIKMVPNAPFLAENLIMSTSSALNIQSNTEFTWHMYDTFDLTYRVDGGTPTPQTQVIQFIIYKKSGLLWIEQSTFNFIINANCPYSEVLGYNAAAPLDSGDYEVTNDLTVANIVKPNGGVAEFDAGQWVILDKGFQTDLSAGGEVFVVIEGCGGSLKPDQGTTQSAPSAANALVAGEAIIYPNPVHDQCTIRVPDAAPGEQVKITVRDINGRILVNTDKRYDGPVTVDFRDLAAGIYLLQVSGERLHYHQKIVKE